MSASGRARWGEGRRLSRRGQRLEVWLVGKNRGIISRRQEGVILFNPCNIFNRPARGFSHRFSAFLLFHSLSLPPSSFRLFVSWFHPRRAFAPGNTFPCIFLASSLSRSPSYARFNYQLFRVSQEFALAPPLPPRRHCFLSYVFFPLFFLPRSSHGPHPRSLWTDRCR